ncbi:unnamed protein product, partial [Amoebophrya sp. A25]
NGHRRGLLPKAAKTAILQEGTMLSPEQLLDYGRGPTQSSSTKEKQERKRLLLRRLQDREEKGEFIMISTSPEKSEIENGSHQALGVRSKSYSSSEEAVHFEPLLRDAVEKLPEIQWLRRQFSFSYPMANENKENFLPSVLEVPQQGDDGDGHQSSDLVWCSDIEHVFQTAAGQAKVDGAKTTKEVAHGRQAMESAPGHHFIRIDGTRKTFVPITEAQDQAEDHVNTQNVSKSDHQSALVMKTNAGGGYSEGNWSKYRGAKTTLPDDLGRERDSNNDGYNDDEDDKADSANATKNRTLVMCNVLLTPTTADLAEKVSKLAAEYRCKTVLLDGSLLIGGGVALTQTQGHAYVVDDDKILPGNQVEVNVLQNLEKVQVLFSTRGLLNAAAVAPRSHSYGLLTIWGRHDKLLGEEPLHGPRHAKTPADSEQIQKLNTGESLTGLLACIADGGKKHVDDLDPACGIGEEDTELSRALYFLKRTHEDAGTRGPPPAIMSSNPPCRVKLMKDFFKHLLAEPGGAFSRSAYHGSLAHNADEAGASPTESKFTLVVHVLVNLK